MKSKIILNLAMSLDGYIADDDGNFDWISGDSNNSCDTSAAWSYSEFLKSIGIVVMGSNSYKQEMHKEFVDKKVFVATSKALKDHDNIRFINGDICKVILAEKERSSKDIFLFGGGLLIDNFLKEDIIDEFVVGIIPIILGSGRPLFFKDNPTIPLKLSNYYIEEGVTILRYSKR